MLEVEISSIYFINVGANTSHQSKARSPIFGDNTFVFVSYPIDKKEEEKKKQDKPACYPPNKLPYVKPNFKTHNDPNWDDMTYGDIIEGRGANLKNVIEGDILLFWGLLYRNECSGRQNHIETGNCWRCFISPVDTNKGWYLLGAMRIKNIIRKNEDIKIHLDDNDMMGRIERNSHFKDGKLIGKNHRIFIGNNKYSKLFDEAVPL